MVAPRSCSINSLGVKEVGTKNVFAMSLVAEAGSSQTLVRRKMWMHVWCFGYNNFIPGRGGVGVEMALAFAAFWDVVVEAVEVGFLLRDVEAETTVFEMITAADVFVVEAGFLDEVVEGAGAAEAGLGGGLMEEGGFAEDGALEETFDSAFDGALEAAFEPAFDPAFDPALDPTFDPNFPSSTALATLLVTVFVEVPLIAVFVSVTTISLPFDVLS